VQNNELKSTKKKATGLRGLDLGANCPQIRRSQFQPFLMKNPCCLCNTLVEKYFSEKNCAILYALFNGGSNLLWKKLQFTCIQLNDFTIFNSSLNLHCTI
jgi:hypothetical protein